MDIYQLSEVELKERLQSLGHPGFRCKQIWSWLYTQGESDFESMGNLPKKLRQQLEREFKIGQLNIDTEQISKDGTRKRLYRLHDGQLIESVLMPYADGRRTACISSQAGCAMGCTFCATGQMGFARQLTAQEIYQQALYFSRELQKSGERLSNIVFMGMGEPFHNYSAVIEAVKLIMDRLGIGARRITISTVGMVPKILQFAQEGLQVKLAISLHETDDSRRDAFMPINRRYPITELIQACRTYVEATSRRVTFEWALIAGQNDSAETAHALGALLKGLLCHVNVIPLNPTEGFLGEPSRQADAQRFITILNTYGIPGTVRVRRGIDIDAGCGQLRSNVIKKKAQ